MRLINQAKFVLVAIAFLLDAGASAQTAGPAKLRRLPPPRASPPAPMYQRRKTPTPAYHTVSYPGCSATVTDRCSQIDSSDFSTARIPRCPGHPSCNRNPYE